MESPWYNEYLLQTRAPAFCAEAGRLCAVNSAAEALGLSPGDVLEEVLEAAEGEAAEQDGTLVRVRGRLFRLRRLEREGSTAFTLLPPELADSPGPASLLRISGSLREISQALNLSLRSLRGDGADPLTQEKAHCIGLQSIYRLERTAAHLSLYYSLASGEWQLDCQPHELRAVFEPLCGKADDLLRYRGLRLRYEFSFAEAEACFDLRLAELCFWELIAGAAAAAPQGEICFQAACAAHGPLNLTVSCRPEAPSRSASFFREYKTLPGEDVFSTDDGFGPALITLAARTHNGRVLLSTGPDGTARTLVSLQTRKKADTPLRAPRREPLSAMDYALVALSAALPAGAYDPDDLR